MEFIIKRNVLLPALMLTILLGVYCYRTYIIFQDVYNDAIIQKSKYKSDEIYELSYSRTQLKTIYENNSLKLKVGLPYYQESPSRIFILEFSSQKDSFICLNIPKLLSKEFGQEMVDLALGLKQTLEFPIEEWNKNVSDEQLCLQGNMNKVCIPVFFDNLKGRNCP